MKDFFTTSASDLDTEISNYEVRLALVDWVSSQITSNCQTYRQLLTEQTTLIDTELLPAINFEAIDGVITPLKGQDALDLSTELTNMIAMGTESIFISGYYVDDAYKMFCGASEMDYEADEFAVETYNEQKALEIYMTKIKDEECSNQLDFMSEESSSIFTRFNQVNTKIENQIYEDAFTFCVIDSSSDFCNEDLKKFRGLLENEAMTLASQEDEFTLSPVIEEGFCSEEFYNAQDILLDTYDSYELILATADYLQDS